MVSTKIRIWRGAPVRRLTSFIRAATGKNNQGRIVNFHRSSFKRRYRIIDYRRRLLDIPAIVLRHERDSKGRVIALIQYASGILSYILAVNGLENLSLISSGLNTSLTPGSATLFRRIPMGLHVHNIEKTPGQGGSFVRAAGTKAQILRKTRNLVVCKLPSGEIRGFNYNCYATIGSLKQASIFKTKKTKAGHSRYLGRRPIVRGVAMNPIDHPHGGGEGKTSGGRPSCSPWGILTKGYNTRNPRKLLTHVFKSRLQVKLDV